MRRRMRLIRLRREAISCDAVSSEEGVVLYTRDGHEFSHPRFKHDGRIF